MDYPKPINDLIDSFVSLPGIGRKTAERLALYVFSNLDEELVKQFSESLISVKDRLFRCPVCGFVSENQDKCEICKDQKRDSSVVMVVENIKDVFTMEKTNEYSGVYHVLNGSINFALGIGVDDLNVNSLIERIKSGSIKEIILATNATTEGETTARYLKALLEDYDVKVTRIAHGLPFGGDISYADEMTLIKAIEGRTKY